MTVTVDPGIVSGSAQPAMVLPGELPLTERLRLAHRRRRRAGTHDLLVSAGFGLAAMVVIAIALFSLIGR